jgi:hypothetical protein
MGHCPGLSRPTDFAGTLSHLITAYADMARRFNAVHGTTVDSSMHNPNNPVNKDSSSSTSKKSPTAPNKQQQQQPQPKQPQQLQQQQQQQVFNKETIAQLSAAFSDIVKQFKEVKTDYDHLVARCSNMEKDISSIKEFIMMPPSPIPTVPSQQTATAKASTSSTTTPTQNSASSPPQAAEVQQMGNKIAGIENAMNNMAQMLAALTSQSNFELNPSAAPFSPNQ